MGSAARVAGAQVKTQADIVAAAINTPRKRFSIRWIYSGRFVVWILWRRLMPWAGRLAKRTRFALC
jgi:hypothetical protein